MAEKPTPQNTPDDKPVISFAEVAKADRPDAPSLAKERTERDRARRAENEAAAAGGDSPVSITPPD